MRRSAVRSTLYGRLAVDVSLGRVHLVSPATHTRVVGWNGGMAFTTSVDLGDHPYPVGSR
jgi:hypothetical protein